MFFEKLKLNLLEYNIDTVTAVKIKKIVEEAVQEGRGEALVCFGQTGTLISRGKPIPIEYIEIDLDSMEDEEPAEMDVGEKWKEEFPTIEKNKKNAQNSEKKREEPEEEEEEQEEDDEDF